MTETQKTWTPDEVAALPVHTEVRLARPRRTVGILTGDATLPWLVDRDLTHEWTNDLAWVSHDGMAKMLRARGAAWTVHEPDDKLANAEVVDEDADAIEQGREAANRVLGVSLDVLANTFQEGREPIDLDALTRGEARELHRTLTDAIAILHGRTHRMEAAATRLRSW